MESLDGTSGRNQGWAWTETFAALPSRIEGRRLVSPGQVDALVSRLGGVRCVLQAKE
jgi:hypothetical protein